MNFKMQYVNPKAVLCFISEDHTAYFTELPLSEQTGNYWDSAPYEHNAGEPYEDINIFKIKYDSELITPAERIGGNSSYSVEQINKGMIPWLSTPSYRNGDDVHYLFAGTTVEKFCECILEWGGEIWFPIMNSED